MNWAHVIFGHVVFAVNFYANLKTEEDQKQFVQDEKYKDSYNLPLPEVYDFIVVGAGAAGCLISNRLAKHNYTVLLLEAGGDPSPALTVPGNTFMYSEFQNITHDYKSEQYYDRHTPEEIHRVINLPVAKVLGGSTSWNFMYYNRGSPFDYDNWANITGDDSWNYENLLKHFKAIESYTGEHGNDQHGYNGEVEVSTSTYAPGAELFLKAGHELGYDSWMDPNGPQGVGFSKIEVSRKNGKRSSSYSAFVENEEKYLKYLTIRRYSTVEEILIDKNSKVAYGVFYKRHGFNSIARARKEVIVSAGTFGTTLLLLKSGIGPAKNLEESKIEQVIDLPVGLNYQDHPIFPMAFQLRDTTTIYTPELNLTENSMKDYIENGTGPLSGIRGLSGQTFLASTFAASPNWPDIQIVVYFHDEQHLPELSHLKNNMIYTWVHLGKPKSKGHIKLKLINGIPELDIDWGMLRASEDIELLQEAIELNLKLFETTPSFTRVGATYPNVPIKSCEHHKFRSKNYWKCYMKSLGISGHHSCCTAKMGKTGDPDAVVDSKLKVIGVNNLRIIDGSIMPIITNTNIQAAVYAIAEKGVDDILKFHEKS